MVLFPLQFKDPLIIMLLCSAVISLFMEQFDDAFSITMVTGLVVCEVWCMLCHHVGYHNCSHRGLHSGVPVRKISWSTYKIGTSKVSLVSYHGYWYGDAVVSQYKEWHRRGYSSSSASPWWSYTGVHWRQGPSWCTICGGVCVWIWNNIW